MFHNKLFMHVLIIVALLSATSAALAQNGPTIVYVKWDATGANNGTSWADAYTSLQDALLAATSDTEIWVAAGTYKPFLTQPVNLEDTFQLKNGVALYGGFAGGETAREQRNWEINVTILDGRTPGGWDYISAYHVVTGSGTDPTAVLDGFTITGGAADPSYNVGGGMLNEAGSPTLTNLIFSGNSASVSGGGMYNSGNPNLTNVTFSDNNAFDGGGMANYYGEPILTDITFSNNHSNIGGGLRTYCGSITLTNVSFNGNSADNHGGGLEGNGCPEDSASILSDVTFIGNSALRGGGMTIMNSNFYLANVTFRGNVAGVYGGGIYNSGSDPMLLNIIFNGNSAGSGGGVYNNNGSPTMVNVTFNGNHAWDSGGGMINFVCSPTLTNVTFSGNIAGDYGGGISNYSCNTTITNSILWGNTAEAGAQIYNDSSSPTVTYSDIQGGYAGASNINADPLFIRPPSPGADGTWGTADDDYGDLHLQSTSPAINAGDNATVPPDVTTDLDGNSRIVGGVVDIGAYEYFPVWVLLYLPLVIR